MSEFLRYIRSVLGFGPSDDHNFPTKTTKKRHAQDEYEHFSAKLRKLNEYKMSVNNYDDWADFPSTSKTRFGRLGPPGRKPIRPLTMRTLNTEIINVSDDEDDIVEVTPRRRFAFMNGNGASSSKPRSSSPADVIQEAKRSIKNCNRYLNDANQSIRLDEQQVYRDMLMNSPRTSAVYANSMSTPNNILHRPENTSARTRRILQLLHGKVSAPVVDLTDDKSNRSNEAITIKDDSDIESTGSKKKVERVNSLKKVLDNEPFMNPNYLTKFEEMRIQKRSEYEKEINEKTKHRDLLNAASRENINLLLEVKVKNCKISDVVLLDEYPEELAFPDFTSDQEVRINEALKSRNPNRIFADKYNLRISGLDLKTLNEKEWLNDEVINFYVNMIQERSHRNKLPKVYSFSTFFYPKLISSGYSSLRRWTKRVDIFSHDIIVVPVHLGIHWCMAIIDFRDKSIRYYDSMLGKNMQCLSALENYVREEHKDKKKSEYDTSDWKKIIMKDIPRQMNGSDCGVFSCTFAEFITRNAKILFTQEHMPYIRRKMVIEIIEGKLLT